MTPTRPRDLLVVVVIVGLLTNVAVQLFYPRLPALPPAAGATLGVLGIAEALIGNVLRARIERRPGTRPIMPLVAARAVLLARASSVAGAVMAGVWAGLLLHTVPRSAEVLAAAQDSIAGWIGLGCAVILVAGGLWLERCCRAPDQTDHTGPLTP